MLWAADPRSRNRVVRAPLDGSNGAGGVPNQACGGGRKAGGEAPLGIKREYIDPPPPTKSQIINKTRVNVAADQRQAARIYHEYADKSDVEDAGNLPGRGVCLCGWTQIKDMDTDLMRVRRDENWHAYVTGRQMCGLRWVCPICTAKRAEEDRRTVNDGLAAARSSGLYPVMITLTTRHFKRESAEEVLAGVLYAEQVIKRRKTWRKMNERGRIAGYARVLEWTYGKRGHHPHFHTILLVRAESEEDAVELIERLRDPYMRALEEAGRDGTSTAAHKRSFQVQGAAAAEGYITKWGAAEELTGAQKKTAKGEGLTIWSLLRLARTAEATPRRTEAEERGRFGAIWFEIIKATKNKSQLYKSKGWTELVEAWRAEQPEPEPEPEPEKVLGLGIREKCQEGSFRFLQARPKMLSVRTAAESQDSLELARSAVLGAIRDGPTDYEIMDGAPNEPPDEMAEVIDRDDGQHKVVELTPSQAKS